MPASRPQSKRTPTPTRGNEAQNHRGKQAHTRSTLKSDRTSNMSGNPTAQRDEHGSRHNADNIKSQQKKAGRQPGSNLAQRESAQDIQPNRGAKNKLPGRRTRNSGGPTS